MAHTRQGAWTSWLSKPPCGAAGRRTTAQAQSPNMAAGNLKVRLRTQAIQSRLRGHIPAIPGFFAWCFSILPANPSSPAHQPASTDQRAPTAKPCSFSGVSRGEVGLYWCIKSNPVAASLTALKTGNYSPVTLIPQSATPAIRGWLLNYLVVVIYISPIQL